LARIELIFTRSWEGTQPGQLTQISQRNIPYDMTSCSVYKEEEVVGEAGITAQERAGHRSASNGTVRHSLYIFFH